MPTAASDRHRDCLASVQAAYKKGHLVLVAGAGVTISSITSSSKTNDAKRAAERLTWPGLLHYGLQYMYERRDSFNTPQKQLYDLYSEQLADHRQELDTQDLIAIADFVKRRMEDHNYNQLSNWLKLSFGHLYVNYIEGEDIQILAAMERLRTGGARIMTTNYDDIIERYCKTYAILPSQRAAMHDFFHGNADGILHVHGLWRNDQSAVLDAVSYRDTTSNLSLQFALRSLFQSPAVLVFIGTGNGLDDPNFGDLLDWAKKEFRSAHRHYVLVRDGEHVKDESVLSPIYYGRDFTDLPPFLDSIISANPETLELPFNGSIPSGNAPETLRILSSDLNATSTSRETLSHATPAPEGDITWRTGSERLVSPHGTSEAAPALTKLDGDLIAVWRGTDMFIFKNHQLYWSRFSGNTDGAPKQSQIRLIHENAYSAERPAVAALAGKLVAAWKAVENDMVYFSTLLPGNLHWENPVPIPNAGSSTGTALASWDLDGSKRVYALWKGNDGDEHAHLAWYDGDRWESPVRLRFVQTDANVGLACLGGDVFVSWKVSRTERIMWMRLDSEGNKLFQEPQDLGVNVESNLGPALAEVRGTIYAAWKGREASADVSLTSWSGDGNSFRPTQLVPNSVTDQAPSLSGWKDWLVVAWKGTDFDKSMWWKYGSTGRPSNTRPGHLNNLGTHF